MSARVTRKRTRVDDEEDLMPPAKREVDAEDSIPGPSGTQHVAESRPTNNNRGYKKDVEFWFNDGTVILVARDIEFRVYKGLLAEHSPVLKGLFAEHHPLRSVQLDQQQTISCPVVQLSDSPEDLRYMLRASVSQRNPSLYVGRDPLYDEISAAVRLGKKYGMTEIYQQSLDYIKHFFPSDFEAWLALVHYCPPHWDFVEALGVVNLARTSGDLSMLPAAFVACICAGSRIVHGLARPDGSREHLAPDDLAVCFAGKSSIRCATIAGVLRTFKPAVAPECKTQKMCRTALVGVLQGLEERVDTLVDGNPFATYDKFLHGGKALAVCPACVSMVEERSRKEREDVWDRLPELLDIDVPGWV